MNMHWFFAWWNLVFILPLGLSLVYLLVMASTGLGMGEAHLDVDADADADMDVDADAHVEVDADAHVEVDSDAHGEVDADADAGTDAENAGTGLVHAHAGGGGHAGGGHGIPLHIAALSVLGLGKVPLSIVLLTLVVTWGILGLLLNATCVRLLPQEWMAAFISLPVAAIGSLAATGGIAAFIQRWLPMTETFVTTKRGLVGKVGQAVFNIDATSGVAHVHDPQGDLFQIDCRVADEGQTIPKGQSVLLVDYDKERNCFYVRAYEPPTTLTKT